MLTAALLLSVLVAPLLAAPAAAQSGGGDDFVVRQGDRCVELAVFGDGSQSVSEFYDYRRDGRWGFSSQGTRDLQQTGTSQLFVYRGTNGTSLVFLHDEYGDSAGGGGISMTVGRLPRGSWPVLDDDYNGSDDRFEIGNSEARLHWMWAQNRTDGAAFRGLQRLGPGGSIRIDPGIGRSSYAGVEAGWPWVDEEYEWAARYGSHPNALAPLSFEEPARVERGSCAGGAGTDAPSTGNPMERELEVTDDGYRLEVGDAHAGDVVTASVPDDAEDARLRTVQIELGRNVEDWTVVWERAGEPEELPDGVSGGARLVPEDGVGPVRRVSYDVRAWQAGEVGQSDGGPPPSDVGVIERRTLSWVVVGADLSRSDDAIHASAASDALRPISIARGVGGSGLPGAPASSQAVTHGLRLTSLSGPDRVAPGESIELRATYENPGVFTAARNVTFAVSGRPVEEARVEVPPENRSTVTFAHAFEEPGTYTVSVGNRTRTVVVDASAVEGAGGTSMSGGLLLGLAGVVGVLASLVAIGRWAAD